MKHISILLNYVINLYKNSFAGLKKGVWLMAAMMFVNRLGTLIMPFLTLYTTKELGWTEVQGGWATTFFGLGGLFGSLIGGWLTDRFGYMRVILVSLIFASVAFFSLQFVVDFYLLCGLLLVSSTISDTLRPAVMSAVTTISGDEERTRAISLLRMAFNLGFAIGPVIGGLIITWTSYRWIFVMDATTCLAAAVFCFYFVRVALQQHSISSVELKKEAKLQSDVRGPFYDGPFLLLMFFSVLMLVPFFQILSTVPLYMDKVLGYEEDMVGAFFALNGALVFIFEMPIVHFTEVKWKLFPAMSAGSILVGLAMLCLMWPSLGLIAMLIYSLLVAFGEIISFPFIATVSVRRTNDANIGQYMGAVSMMFSTAIVIAPISGTKLIEIYGYSTAFFVFGVSALIAGFGYLYVRKLFVAGEGKKVLVD